MRGEKLGSAAKLLLSGEDARLKGAEVDVLVRVREAPDRAMTERLQQAGLRVRSTAGDVATASLRVDQLESVTDLDEVVAIELAQPLHMEKERPSDTISEQ